LKKKKYIFYIESNGLKRRKHFGFTLFGVGN
jgi:hypothetical protein